MLPTTGTKWSTWLNLIVSVLAGGLAGFDPTILTTILGPPWGAVLISVITAINAIAHAVTGNTPQLKVTASVNPDSE